MYFNNDNNYFDFNMNNYMEFDSNTINVNRDTSLNEVYDGFNNGNFFKNNYSKYKNHSYKLKVNNQKDKLLFDIQAYGFVLKDLNLYLDTHPNDVNYLNKFIKYKRDYLKLYDEYVSKYGPLCFIDVDSVNRWTWIDNKWPWDKGDK